MVAQVKNTLNHLNWFLLILFFSFPLIAQSQITLSGSVMDSVSRAPLHYVIIQTSQKVVAITGEDGLFELTCRAGDTISFTRLGFKTVVQIKLRSEKGMTVQMGESSTVLKSITIFGDYKPYQKAKWREYVILPKPFQNPNMRDSAGVIQTFGLGVRIPGPISYFTRYEKNRRKYKRVIHDQELTEIYREVMASDEVKQDLMKLFSLPESAYYKKIEKFNIAFPDIAYEKDRKEIITTLTQFFALKEN